MNRQFVVGRAGFETCDHRTQSPFCHRGLEITVGVWTFEVRAAERGAEWGGRLDDSGGCASAEILGRE